MEHIPDSFRDLLTDEKKAFLALGTVMPDDGALQVTPVWFNHDGEDILINSAKGRVKDRNMRAHREVACMIVDPDNPYRYLQIRGPVVEITEKGADDHIRQLAKKYRGKAEFDIGDSTRVTYRIRPESISAKG